MSSNSVIVDGPNSPEAECPASTPVSINVTAGTVNGDECEPLSFAENLTGAYDIRYRNGTNVDGTYRLTVDGNLGESYVATGDPSATDAVYAAETTVTYRTPRLDYRTTIRVAPGETDE